MLLHTKTQTAYQKFLSQKPHALLLVGRAGSGKTTLARQYAEELLTSSNLESHPFYSQFDASEKGIDAVRELHQFFSKKTTGKADIRRISLLTNAEQLSDSAQNALLKIIEEPPEDSILMLTATDTTDLLPTIKSRVQVLHVLPLELQQVLGNPELQKHDQNKLVKAFHMSGGAAGLFQALLADDEHELVTSLLEAKKIIGASVFERLVLVDELAKGKQDIRQLLDSLQRVLDSGFYLAVSKSQPQAKKLHNARKAVAEARSQLAHSVNQKLLLTNLFTRL